MYSKYIDLGQHDSSIFPNNTWIANNQGFEGLLNQPADYIYDSSVHKVHFNECEFTNFTLPLFNENTLLFFSCKFQGLLSIDIDHLEKIHIQFFEGAPDTLLLYGECQNLKEVSLENLHLLNRNNKKCVVVIENGKIFDGLKLHYPEFSLAFVYANKDKINGYYETLLRNFSSEKDVNNFKFFDIEFQRFKNLHNNFFTEVLWWVPEYWTNYGYNKEWPIYWAVVFLLFFTIINYFLFPFLNANVYRIDKVPIMRRDWKGRRFWYSFFYTANIFFRLTLKLDKLESRPIIATAYIMWISTLGTICLAYMANFVIQK